MVLVQEYLSSLGEKIFQLEIKDSSSYNLLVRFLLYSLNVMYDNDGKLIFELYIHITDKDGAYTFLLFTLKFNNHTYLFFSHQLTYISFTFVFQCFAQTLEDAF